MTKTATCLLALVTISMAACTAQFSPAVRQAQTGPQTTAQNKRPDPSKFLAHADVQALSPKAFSTHPESQGFLQALAVKAPSEREALVAAIRATPGLAAGISRYPTLSWDEQLPILKQVMALEAKVMGFTQPPLILESGTSRSAFFDFDPAKPDTGRVLLYPEALANETNPYDSLLLLIHETRHSGQFQQAFGAKRTNDPLAAGYKAAFIAQKELQGKLGFCDFCSLNNEFEAFQTANYVVGKLTNWQVDTLGMGCYSSQFDAKGQPKLDLLKLFKQVGPQKLLDAFNERSMEQFDLLTRPKAQT